MASEHSGPKMEVAVSNDKTVRQFDAKSHKQVRRFEGHGDWVLSSAYSGTTKKLATGSFDGEVRIWNMADGKLLTRFIAAPGHEPKGDN